RSPLTFQLPGEGVYGLKVVVTSNDGLGGAPPTAGEMPDIWAEVHLPKAAPPRARAINMIGAPTGRELIRVDNLPLLPTSITNLRRGEFHEMTQIKATNITWHEGHVTAEERSKLLRQKGVTIWFTGLSGSGKSTIAFTLEHALVQMGHLAYVLD